MAGFEDYYIRWRAGMQPMTPRIFLITRYIYFRKVWSRIVYKLTWKALGYKNHIRIHFRKRHGYRLNLNEPQTLAEKIQWIKIYGNLERFSKYADKYDMRALVEQTIGKEFLIPLIGVYERPEDIDIEALPDSFVVKATHGSGWNIIVKDKAKADWAHINKKLKKWISSNYYNHYGETIYKPLKGRVIVEELIKNHGGDLLEYKFYCSRGEPAYIAFDATRFENHRRDLYDLEWNKLPVVYHYPNLDTPAEKPQKLEEMIGIARKLSKGFPFVRVDLYCAGEKIYFSEMTFTPSDGMKAVTPPEFGYIFGQLIHVEDYLNEP